MKRLEFFTLLALTFNGLFFIGMAIHMFCTEYGIVGPLLVLVAGFVTAIMIALLYVFCCLIRQLLNELDKPVSTS